LEQQEQMAILENAIEQASFTAGERYVFDNRVMSDAPKTLQEIADALNISRERARQLEAQVLKKIKSAVSKAIRTRLGD
jgi:RNA polymerase sigma-32 factor